MYVKINLSKLHCCQRCCYRMLINTNQNEELKSTVVYTELIVSWTVGSVATLQCSTLQIERQYWWPDLLLAYTN